MPHRPQTAALELQNERHGNSVECKISGDYALSLSGDLHQIAADAADLRRALASAEQQQLVSRLADEQVQKYGVISMSPDRPAGEAFLLPVYRGLYEFLSQAGDNVNYSTRLALLVSAWQWFQTTKRLINQRDHPTQQNEKNLLIDDLARAHNAVVQILNDSRYTHAIHLMVKNLMDISDLDAISDSLRREALLLSLVLVPKEPVHAAVGLGKVIPPFHKVGTLIVAWNKMKLLSVFREDEGGQAVVRRLIVGTLLPRYNFRDAFQLAFLSKKVNAPGRDVWRNIRFFVLLPWLAAVVLTIWHSFQTNTAQPTVSVLGPLDTNSFFYWGWIVLQIVLWLAIPLSTLALTLDWRVLPNFALPRVIGGVSIGYLALALQGDSLSIAGALWSRGGWLVVLVWLSVMVVGFGYLFFDARPLTGDDAYARGRAGWALLAAVSIAVLSGLLVTAVTTMAYAGAGGTNGWMQTFALGPFGWFSLGQFFVFVPIALLTGLLTQFIFEELTLPASVWSPEE